MQLTQEEIKDLQPIWGIASAIKNKTIKDLSVLLTEDVIITELYGASMSLFTDIIGRENVINYFSEAFEILKSQNSTLALKLVFEDNTIKILLQYKSYCPIIKSSQITDGYLIFFATRDDRAYKIYLSKITNDKFIWSMDI